jgi:hypothetical protein
VFALLELPEYQTQVLDFHLSDSIESAEAIVSCSEMKLFDRALLAFGIAFDLSDRARDVG